MLVAASKPATKDLAPFLRELRPLVREPRPTIHDLRALVHRPGADNDLTDLLLQGARSSRRSPSPRSPTRSQALRERTPVLTFVRPYAPDSSAGSRDFGQGASNYDANGHYARIQPDLQRLLVQRQPGRPARSRPTARDQRLGGLPDRRVQALPGQPPRSPRPTGPNPWRDDSGQLDCDPNHVPARPMRRVLAIGAVLLVAVVVVVAVAHRRGRRRAAATRSARSSRTPSVIPGEDVKVAGVKVGKIESLDVTPDNKAAVVLNITEPGFQDFRARRRVHDPPAVADRREVRRVHADAAAARGRARAAAAAEDPRRPGRGRAACCRSATRTQPVDLDLLNNIMRLPYRQRFAIIINELGTGLAGRGAELRQAIRNADPALQQTDKVLAILAGQNQMLAELAVDCDKVLAPLARDRRQVPHFVDSAGTVGDRDRRASSQALERNLELLPPFLRQLRPTVRELGALRRPGDAGPVRPAAPWRPTSSRVFEQLGPFSQAAIPAFTSLGQAADVGRTALVKTDADHQASSRRSRSRAKPLAKQPRGAHRRRCATPAASSG